MDIIHVFATNVRARRKAQGLSQEKLAEICGLHRTYISDIERCERNVSLENVQRIAAALSVAPHQLLKEEDDEE